MHYFSCGSQKKEILILHRETMAFLRSNVSSGAGNGFINVI
jgi:hypothetical protein